MIDVTNIKNEIKNRLKISSLRRLDVAKMTRNCFTYILSNYIGAKAKGNRNCKRFELKCSGNCRHCHRGVD